MRDKSESTRGAKDAKVNEEKNARANAIHRVRRAVQDKYRQVRSKSRQLDEEALIEIERHKRLNNVKRPFGAKVAMCRDKNGELLMSKTTE
jgi:hypothetical protein